MTERLLDAQGNPVGQEKKVIANLNEDLGIKLSQRGMAMLDVMVTSEMLHNYALQSIAQEVPDDLEEARKTVQDQMEEMGNFNLETIKYRLFDAIQVVMTHFAEIHLMAAMAKDAEEKGEDIPQPGTDGQGGVTDEDTTLESVPKPEPVTEDLETEQPPEAA